MSPMRTVLRHKILLSLTLALVMLVGLAAFGLWPRLKDARCSARQTMCVHNLKFLAIGLKAYADDHDGRFLDRLSALWPEYVVSLEVFVCPEVQVVCRRKHGVSHPYPNNPDADTIERMSNYEYVPGHTISDPADTVIAYEKVDNHYGRGRSLLYLDGHGAWEPPKNWRNGPPNKTLPPGFRKAGGSADIRDFLMALVRDFEK